MIHDGYACRAHQPIESGRTAQVKPLQVVGHRGAKNEAPENTIAGFRYARRIGLTAVELDVRLSKDHAIVVIHDDTVDRTTNGTGPVAEFTAAELAELDARGTCPNWPEPTSVPTLDQVLDVIQPLTSFQIEIKRDAPEHLEEIVAGVLHRIRTRGLGDQAIITSFDIVALEVVQRLAPGQSRAYINRYQDPEALETALRLGCTQANFFQMPTSPPETEHMIRQARDAGLRIAGGTCNSGSHLERVLAWRADAIGSDVPSDMLARLAAE